MHTLVSSLGRCSQPQFRYHINIVRFLTVELDRFFEIIIGLCLLLLLVLHLERTYAYVLHLIRKERETKGENAATNTHTRTHSRKLKKNDAQIPVIIRMNN